MPREQVFPGSFGMGAPAVQAILYRENKPGFNLDPYITSISIEKDLSQPAGMFELHLAYTPDKTVDLSLHPPGRGGAIQPISGLVDGVKPFDYITMTIQDRPGPRNPTYY